MSATNTPKGLQKKLGVTIEGGCGDAECRDCYEPEGLPVSWPADLSTRIALEIREQVEVGNVGLVAGNAARVAAAYYAPAVKALRVLADAYGHGLPALEYRAAMEKARAAIAKAEGRGE